MPRPLKNNEINEKIADLKSVVDNNQYKVGLQDKINIGFAFLILILLGATFF